MLQCLDEELIIVAAFVIEEQEAERRQRKARCVRLQHRTGRTRRRRRSRRAEFVQKFFSSDNLNDVRRTRRVSSVPS
ncbi:hypothetical protein J6590_051433 [Homalodisca vitripennis]|nr:hypothetical protein J6590_051433 [Homalodisca vitripennis]